MSRCVLLFGLSLVPLAVLWAEPAKEPALAPLPEKVEHPKENPATPEKVALGRQLFFDPRLSRDDSLSCSSCHDPAKGFADGRKVGKGFAGKDLSRNTPTVLNVGLARPLSWDGRAKTLEEQSLLPVTHAQEMNQDLGDLEKKLGPVPGYAAQFKAVFGTGVKREGIALALAAYQRTLVSRNSPFDRYLAGDKKDLSDEATRGLELFRGSAGCVQCHNGPLLSDGKFYRLGVGGKDDLGRAAVTGNKEDRYKFRTPSLRDVARTGPYMHDGSLATLFDVVQYYYRNAPATGHDGLPLDIQVLSGNSFTEVADLVAFLESLTGEPPKETKPELPK